MKKALLVGTTILLVAVAAVYVSERGATHAQIADNTFVWFAAVKYDPEAGARPFITGDDKIEWRSRADSVLVGDGPPYWDEFFVMVGNDLASLPTLPTSLADAYIVRIEPVRLPLLLSGTLSMLHELGISRMPDGDIGEDFSEAGIKPGLGPSLENVATLKSKPPAQKPAMVNFLRYRDTAQYSQSKDESGFSGLQAYAQYGSVAFRTVYSLGGKLVTSGKIVEVIRESEAGPTHGEWHNIAIMQYPTQQAILSMEQVPAYREALTHRNAGLERTRVVASLVF